MTELPRDVIQNLLTLSRLRWRARNSEGCSAQMLARLEFATKAFEQALTIAALSPPDALEWSTRGLEALGEATRGGDESARALADAAEKLLSQTRRI